jgi:hypothetical protein
MFPTATEEQIDYVCKTLLDVLAPESLAPGNHIAA